MLTLDEIKLRLGDRKLSRVAAEIGVDPGTMYSIVRDPHHRPRYDTVKRLSDYLLRQSEG